MIDLVGFGFIKEFFTKLQIVLSFLGAKSAGMAFIIFVLCAGNTVYHYVSE